MFVSQFAQELAYFPETSNVYGLDLDGHVVRVERELLRRNKVGLVGWQKWHSFNKAKSGLFTLKCDRTRTRGLNNNRPRLVLAVHVLYTNNSYCFVTMFFQRIAAIVGISIPVS